MEATKEQIASDIVRNLSEALANLYRANADSCLGINLEARVSIETKLRKWIEKL